MARDRCHKKALEIAGNDTFRNGHFSTGRWDCRSYRVATTAMWGRRRGVLRTTPSGIVTAALYAGTVGATVLPRQQCGVAEEVSFGEGHRHHHLRIGIAGGERLLELPHHVALDCCNNASGKI